MEKPRIRHTVAFTLVHPKDSAAARGFLDEGERILRAIPGVERFEALRQVSPKNDYDFVFSMEFADRPAYDRYSAHPMHGDFVARRWVTEVVRFLENDMEAL